MSKRYKFTDEEFNEKLKNYPTCPGCDTPWEHIKPKELMNRTKEGTYILKQITITRDHITPRSKGGSDNLDNIQPMCYRCNTRKGNKMSP